VNMGWRGKIGDRRRRSGPRIEEQCQPKDRRGDCRMGVPKGLEQKRMFGDPLWDDSVMCWQCCMQGILAGPKPHLTNRLGYLLLKSIEMS